MLKAADLIGKRGIFSVVFFLVVVAAFVVVLSVVSDRESIHSSPDSSQLNQSQSNTTNQLEQSATTQLERKVTDSDPEVAMTTSDNGSAESGSEAETSSEADQNLSFKAIAPNDIVTTLDPATGVLDWLGSARNIQLQSSGQIINYPFELPLEFKGSPRISVAQDAICGPAISFVATSEDPDTAGQAAIRTESRHSEALPMQENFWQVFRIKTSDFSQTSDDQIIFQWHDGDGTAQDGSLNPFLSFNLTGNKLVVAARSNPGTPNNETNDVHILHTDNNFAHETWYEFVVQAKISPTGGGFVNIWRNGNQIVEYSGPFGYNDGSTAHNAKMGLYHWATESYNSWDRLAPSRSVAVDFMAVINDKEEQYRFSDVESHMNQNAGCG